MSHLLLRLSNFKPLSTHSNPHPFYLRKFHLLKCHSKAHASNIPANLTQPTHVRNVRQNINTAFVNIFRDGQKFGMNKRASGFASLSKLFPRDHVSFNNCSRVSMNASLAGVQFRSIGELV